MSDHCCDHHEAAPAAPVSGPRRWAAAVRFLGLFAAFSGVYAMGAVCPFCGRQGCPAGTASAGMVGLVFASLMQWGRLARAALGRQVKRWLGRG
jgi:hypothetical protein